MPVYQQLAVNREMELFRRLFAGVRCLSGSMGKQKGRTLRLFAGLFQRVGERDLWQAEGEMWGVPHQAFIPPSEDIIEKHLRGGDARSGDFVAGVYPLLQDETCWFLAADFDKESWADDARALLATCHAKGIAAALERSRSGNGGHVWIFFSEPVPARTARQMGSALITETMEKRPEIGFTSYDRSFPIRIRCRLEASEI